MNAFQELVASFIAKGSVKLPSMVKLRVMKPRAPRQIRPVVKRKDYNREYMRGWRAENLDRHRENSREGMRRLRQRIKEAA